MRAEFLVKVCKWVGVAGLSGSIWSIAQDQIPDAKSDQTAPRPEVNAPVSEMNIKEIKKLSPTALVVLDKNCPAIVQPYKLEDNAASLAVFGIEEATKEVKKTFTEKLKEKLREVIPGAKTTAASVDPPAVQGEISNSMRLAAKQLNWLPMSAEVAYGEKSHATETNLLERQSKLGQKYYPMADALLTEILSTIKEPHDYQFKLFILKNSTRNAVARPGGYLYLDQGLLESPEQRPIAHFALSHEIAHVLQRHETKELQSLAIDSVTTKNELVKLVTKAKEDPRLILAHVKVSKDAYTQHHVDQELQSDACAARILSRVIPDRNEFANTLNAFLRDLPPPEADKPRSIPRTEEERVIAAGHDVVTTPLKRHPSTRERSANLQKMYQEVSKSE